MRRLRLSGAALEDSRWGRRRRDEPALGRVELVGVEDGGVERGAIARGDEPRDVRARARRRAARRELAGMYASFGRTAPLSAGGKRRRAYQI